MFAIPNPRSFPHRSKMFWATRSPCRAAAATSCAVIFEPSIAERQLCCPSLSAAWAARAIAGPATNVSNSPFPVALGTFSRVMVSHPAQPDSSCAPRIIRPPLRMPAPMPVPIINTTTSDLPRPAPRQHSPSTAALRSLSTSTGIPSARLRRLASGIFSQPGRFGAQTVPFRRTSPGTATAAAANTLCGLFPSASSFPSSMICRKGPIAEL